MDPIYAEMLRELGIIVDAAEEEEEEIPGPSSPSYTPESPPTTTTTTTTYEFYERPHFEAQWDHMQHTQREPAKAPYKRSTHFLAHLNQVTGRNGIQRLPRGVISRLKRAGVNIRQPHAYFRIRRLLKRWGYSSPEYRLIFAILRSMGGLVLSLSYAQERQIRADFDHLCWLFERLRPMGTKRKAFPSYYLVLQLLLKKYSINSYYLLPSIKDANKFQRIIDGYCLMTGAAEAHTEDSCRSRSRSPEPDPAPGASVKQDFSASALSSASAANT